MEFQTQGGRNVIMRRGSDLSSGHAPISSPKEPEVESGIRGKSLARFFDSIITGSLFLIFLGVPLFFTNLTYQGIVFEKQIYFYFFLLLALIAWAAKGVVSGELKIRRTPLDIPVLIFWFVYLLSTIFSVDRWHSFWGFFGDPSRGFLSVTALVIAYFLIFSHLNERRLKLMLSAVAASGVVVSIWMTLGIMGIKFLPAKLANFAPLSLIGSVSGAGAYLSLLIPIMTTAIFILRAREDVGHLKKNIFTGALILGLVLSLFLVLALFNYIPWIGLLLGMGVFLIYILSRIVRPVESWTWLPMATFVVIMAILMIGAPNIARVNLPVEISPAYKISAQVARGAVGDKFILGTGPATYGYDFSLYRPADFNQNYFYNLRFYQGTGILSEGIPTTGILGTIASVLLVLTFLSVTFYLLSREREKNKLTSLGLCSAMVVFLAYAVTARIEGTMLIMGALLGTLTLAALLWESDSEEKSINLSLKASPKYALALAFIFMVITAGVAYLFVFVGKTFVADAYAGQAVRQTDVAENGSISELLKAVNLNGKESRYYTQIGQEYMVLANQEALKSQSDRDLNKLGNYINNSIAAAAAGRDLAPNDVLAVESLAQVYENAIFYDASNLDKAEGTYQRAQQLEPHNPNYFIKLGQIKITRAAQSKDDNEKKNLIGQAKDLFQKAIDEKKDLAPGYYQLSLANEALNDLDAAVNNMQQAFALDRSNITYAFNLGRLYQARGTGDDNKNAEDIFKQILGVNDKEINTHFSLGLLYEKTGRKSDALGEYQKVLSLLPDDQKDAKTSVQKMIDNLQNGVSNITANGTNNSVVPSAPSTNSVPAATDQTAPTGQTTNPAPAQP